ncbi:Hypothetical protein A7982_03340 [Minicystis rosea]|nr:Hypothetical protein A7982_03340 [Minicystis rosea]
MPPPPAARGPSTFGGISVPGDWKFDFHGYFRAPMRIGLGHNDNPATGQSASTVHYPLVPDDQYLSWQYTGVQAKDWSEVFLSYGNSWVKGTVGLQGFNFTDAAWQNAKAQFGIAQAWVTLTPHLGYQNVRLEAKVGSFWNRYGGSGKYDAGRYDTYLFGRTHAMGESVRMAIDIDKVTLWAEQGFGVKQPDPNMYNPSKFSLLFHGHGGVSWNKIIDLNFHVLHAWAKEEDRTANSANPQPFTGLPDGSVTILGPEIRVSNTPAGELYLGFSHIRANHATVVTDVVEVIHSGGGQTYSQGLQGNYLDGPTKSSNGNGKINTLLLQYDFSLANLLANLKSPRSQFWGDGPDLAASFFMMFNSVSSDDPDMDGVKKLKYGADLLGTPLKWLGIGIRYDRVQPNSKIPEQSFGILSPRIVFRTAFVTHEEISFQYSRYMYNQRACPTGDTGLHCVQPPPAPTLPSGFGTPTLSLDPDQRGAPNSRPDLNVLKLQASMWW